MATVDWSDDECEDGSAVLGTFEPRYEKIQVQIGALPKEDIAQELLGEFDKQELRELRAKTFKFVQEKAARGIQFDQGGNGNPDAAFVKHDQTPLSQNYIARE